VAGLRTRLSINLSILVRGLVHFRVIFFLGVEPFDAFSYDITA
jgi:hypothetical protein